MLWRRSAAAFIRGLALALRREQVVGVFFSSPWPPVRLMRSSRISSSSAIGTWAMTSARRPMMWWCFSMAWRSASESLERAAEGHDRDAQGLSLALRCVFNLGSASGTAW